MKGIKLILLGIATLVFAICSKIVYTEAMAPFNAIALILGFALIICGFLKKDDFNAF